MAVEVPDDPTKTLGRWVLQACAKVRREAPERAEFLGLLLSEPEVGAPMVLALGQRRRLTTTRVKRIEDGPEGSIYVYTGNSVYWVRRLSQLGLAEETWTSRADTSKDRLTDL
ncbi:MAG: hypothetical protein R6X02_34575 [Enhygromyxa sp.]